MQHSQKISIAILSFTLTGMTTSALAQSTVHKNSDLEIQGNLDFYYQHSSEGHSAGTAAGAKILEGRYFDRNSQELTLNFAELVIKKKLGKVQARLDFSAGEMVDQMSGGPISAATEPTRNITQATLSYQATDQLSLSFGKFYTNIGYEVTRSKENWQYSRSYLFNYGPFWHQGVSVTYALIPGTLTGTLFILNGWDGRSSQQTNSDVTWAANLNYVASSQFTVNYNYIGGDENANFGRRELHELNALYQITDDYALAIDAQTASQQSVNSQTMHWQGIAIYLKAKMNSFYTISPRVEYFDDTDGFAITSGFSGNNLVSQKITAYTLTNSLDFGDGLEGRLELRHDHSSTDQFFKTDKGGGTQNQTSYTLALLYGF